MPCSSSNRVHPSVMERDLWEEPMPYMQRNTVVRQLTVDTTGLNIRGMSLDPSRGGM